MKQRFSTRTRLVSALLTLAMVCTFLPFSAFAATDIYGPVYISDLTFPDETFLNYVKWFDTDKNGTLSPEERYKVTEIYVSGKKITSLKGIEFFPNLKKLYCADNNLTSLDVNQNTALEHLDCDNNQLTSLQLDDCTNLGTYNCDGNEYSVQVYESTRILDPGTLPGKFDISRVRNMNGATKNADGTMTVNPGVGKVTYKYRFLRDNYATFTLNVEFIPEGSIVINASNFPDPVFLEYVKRFDKDNNGLLSTDEREAVTKIDVRFKNISNLSGIQFFPNLKELNCNYNQLTSLDVSQNPALQYLYCAGNNLTSLDVSKNTKLTELECYQNQLTELDVRQNAALTYLGFSKNNLTSLDVSHNTQLEQLDCGRNQLTELDVHNNTKLWYLACSENKLTSLDLSQNTKLNELYCSDNQLTSLDVSQNAALDYLSCQNNQLTSLDVSQNPAMWVLVCNGNQLTSLDVSQNTKLSELVCYQNQLTSLDVSKNTKLSKLECYQNHLTSLDVSQTAVTELKASDNQITINVETTPRTFDLSILPGFDVSKASGWNGGTVDGSTLKVDEGATQVTYTYDCGKGFSKTFTLNVTVVPEGSIGINASNFPDPNFRAYVKAKFDKNNDNFLSESERNAVTSIDLHNGYNGQKLVSLDGIEHFPNLTTLICYNNQLTSLDVSKNTGLLTLSCYENNLTSLDVSQNTKLEELLCGKNQLTELDVRNNTALWCLSCYENKLTSLDVSQNTQLEQLDCGRNQLTELDVRNNTALWYLACSENKLTSLDLSQNTKLNELYCSDNQLTSLDVSQTVVATLKASGNQISINIEETPRTFDLSILPGFDVSKASGWVGGTVDGSTLKVDEGATQVTYTYDCGKGFSKTFTLNVTVVPDGTVTPPSGGGGTGTTTPPSGGEGTGTVTPPSGGGTGTTTPPSGGDGTGTTTPPSGGSTGGDSGGGAVIIMAAGAAVAGVVGYGVYNYVSGQKLQALLPEGVAAPENRAQTALLLWNTAGRPEPAEAPAFADVADPDTAKAAQWCVEQGLMKRRLNGKFAPDSSIPAYQVLNAYRKLAG